MNGWKTKGVEIGIGVVDVVVSGYVVLVSAVVLSVVASLVVVSLVVVSLVVVSLVVVLVMGRSVVYVESALVDVSDVQGG